VGRVEELADLLHQSCAACLIWTEQIGVWCMAPLTTWIRWGGLGGPAGTMLVSFSRRQVSVNVVEFEMNYYLKHPSTRRSYSC